MAFVYFVFSSRVTHKLSGLSDLCAAFVVSEGVVEASVYRGMMMVGAQNAFYPIFIPRRTKHKHHGYCFIHRTFSLISFGPDKHVWSAFFFRKAKNYRSQKALNSFSSLARNLRRWVEFDKGLRIDCAVLNADNKVVIVAEARTLIFIAGSRREFT